MKPIKVHPGLGQLSRDQVYHLGYYQVDFADGPLTFQCHVRICPKRDCCCDDVLFDWLSGNSGYQTWYTGERQWRDGAHQPLAAEMEQVFRIVEQIEVFQERYRHLVYLRRKMVLTETRRDGHPFETHLPRALLPPNSDPATGVLGNVLIDGGKGQQPFQWHLEFCGDEACYCQNLFLVLAKSTARQTVVIAIDPQSKWSALDGTTQSERLMKKARRRFARLASFDELLGFMRGERRLANYHRFVAAYESQQLPLQPVSHRKN